ncbi:hypothetical protein AB4Z52_25765 [Rhizobium sp. 2YAF20]
MTDVASTLAHYSSVVADINTRSPKSANDEDAHQRGKSDKAP